MEHEWILKLQENEVDDTEMRRHVSDEEMRNDSNNDDVDHDTNDIESG